MRKFVFVVSLMMLSGMAFADNGGEGNNTGCNGQGNANSPCQPGTPGGGTDPGTPVVNNGGAGGNGIGVGVGIGIGVGVASADASATAVNSTEVRNTNTNLNSNTVRNDVTNVQGQQQGQVQGQVANGGSVTLAEGAVTNTNTNTANGGEGGSVNLAEGAVVATGGTVESGAVSVTIQDGALRGAPVSLSTEYVEVRQAPSVGQGSFAISGCSVGGNAGGSNIHGSMFLGFGWTPSQCYDFMLAQAYQSIGEKKAVCDILRQTKAGKRAEKRGITLPECLPTVVVIATPVAPAPVDLAPYATKEELNRAFRASQTK